MKKIIILTTIITSMTLSYAEYSFKQPLENFNGGSLPNNSINIKQITPTGGSDDPNVTICLSDRVVGYCENNVFNGTSGGRGASGTCSGNSATVTSLGRTTTFTCLNEFTTSIEYTEWFNSGETYGCNESGSNPNTVTSCNQDQIRQAFQSKIIGNYSSTSGFTTTTVPINHNPERQTIQNIIKECSYSFDIPVSYWAYYQNNENDDPTYGNAVSWKGNHLTNNFVGLSTTYPRVSYFENGGYRYFPEGASIVQYPISSAYAYYYKLCRTPI